MSAVRYMRQRRRAHVGIEHTPPILRQLAKMFSIKRLLFWGCLEGLTVDITSPNVREGCLKSGSNVFWSSSWVDTKPNLTTIFASLDFTRRAVRHRDRL